MKITLNSEQTQLFCQWCNTQAALLHSEIQERMDKIANLADLLDQIEESKDVKDSEVDETEEENEPEPRNIDDIYTGPKLEITPFGDFIDPPHPEPRTDTVRETDFGTGLDENDQVPEEPKSLAQEMITAALITSFNDNFYDSEKIVDNKDEPGQWEEPKWVDMPNTQKQSDLEESLPDIIKPPIPRKPEFYKRDKVTPAGAPPKKIEERQPKNKLAKTVEEAEALNMGGKPAKKKHLNDRTKQPEREFENPKKIVRVPGVYSNQKSLYPEIDRNNPPF